MWTKVPSWKPFLITVLLCFSTVCTGFIYIRLLLYHCPCISSLCALVCPHLHCKCPVQASESLRGKERKEWWLNRTESAERGGALSPQGQLGSSLTLTSWGLGKGHAASQGVPSHPHSASSLSPLTLSQNHYAGTSWLDVNVSSLAYKWIQLIL